jgi:hypothetical protein
MLQHLCDRYHVCVHRPTYHVIVHSVYPYIRYSLTRIKIKGDGIHTYKPYKKKTVALFRIYKPAITEIIQLCVYDPVYWNSSALHRIRMFRRNNVNAGLESARTHVATSQLVRGSCGRGLAEPTDSENVSFINAKRLLYTRRHATSKRTRVELAACFTCYQTAARDRLS